jgi:hypothetical protein
MIRLLDCISSSLLAFGFWLLAFGFWLLAFGFWQRINKLRLNINKIECPNSIQRIRYQSEKIISEKT